MLVQSNLALVASTNERKITLYDLFDRYLKSVSKASADNIKYYINDFKELIEDKDLVDVTVDDIQFYIDYKKSLKLKDTTIYRYYRVLVTIFNYAVSHEYIDKNPCSRC